MSQGNTMVLLGPGKTKCHTFFLFGRIHSLGSMVRMDASDIIRKLQTRTNFNYTLGKLRVTQPTINISTCAAIPAATILNFTSYEDRINFYQGKQFNSTCTTTAGPFS